MSKPIIGRFFPNLVRVRSLIHSALKRNTVTLRKVLAPFSVSHVIAIDSCSLLSRSFSLRLFFFSFLILKQLVIAFLIMKTIILLGLAGYQIIITISALRASLVIYHIQRAHVVRKFASTHARL